MVRLRYQCEAVGVVTMTQTLTRKCTWEDKDSRMGCSSLPYFPVWFHYMEEMLICCSLSHQTPQGSRSLGPTRMLPTNPCISISAFLTPLSPGCLL